MTAKNDTAAWLEIARRALAPLSDQPALEAQVLLASAFERPRPWVLAHPQAALSSQQSEKLTSTLARRLSGEPLPYILGRWEFFGLEFSLSPAVLIPRPETELLVEEALAWLGSQPAPGPVVDVGAGSGCIAISLAKNCAGLQVIASDLSRPALQVSRQNALRHGLQSRVHLLQADLVESLAAPLSLVCANLPYIPTATLAGLPVTRFEPRLALDGGPDGLRLVERLLEQCAARLAPGGLLLCEIEAGQGPSAERLARRYFPQAEIRILPDLAGRTRLLRVNRL